MRIVVQRVDKANVTVSGRTVGEIKKGYLVLLGVKEGDTKEDAIVLADKLAKLRVMADEKDRMNLNLSDSKGGVLVVSQFTLYADTSKGNRPSFIKAASPMLAEELYKLFIERLKYHKLDVNTGEFGAYMDINTSLDGPVTIIIES